MHPTISVPSVRVRRRNYKLGERVFSVCLACVYRVFNSKLAERVFSMCLDGIVAYHHDVELHVTSMSTGDDLVFLCSIANDAETFSTSMEGFEDEFIDLIDNNDLADDLENATEICSQLGTSD